MTNCSDLTPSVCRKTLQKLATYIMNVNIFLIFVCIFESKYSSLDIYIEMPYLRNVCKIKCEIDVFVWNGQAVICSRL